VALRRRLQELEPISPELVLVSPPEEARRAREELPEPFVGYAAAAVRGPRSRRRRHRIALASAAIAAVALVYIVVGSDRDRHAHDVSAAAASPRSAPPKSREAALTETATAASPPSAVVTAAPTVNPERSGNPKRLEAKARRGQSSGFLPARTWTWPMSRGASAYELRLLRNGRAVLDVRTTRPQLVLPRTFRFRAGTYRWIVQQIPLAANRRPIVDSEFVLTDAAAKRANG
jgi:hypothetical protein